MKQTIVKACHILALINILILPLIVMVQWKHRGYFAIGGEWMLPALPMLIAFELEHPVEGDE